MCLYVFLLLLLILLNLISFCLSQYFSLFMASMREVKDTVGLSRVDGVFSVFMYFGPFAFVRFLTRLLSRVLSMVLSKTLGASKTSTARWVGIL